MAKFSATNPVKIAIVGAGSVSDYHHVPGIRLDPRAKLVAVCDANPQLLDRRRNDWQVDYVTTDYEQVCRDPEIDAVIIATPNFTHRPIAVAAAAHGKHMMCEKPLGLNAGEVRAMYHAARDAGVVHMTAFTYRFAPSMRYLRQLVVTRAVGRAASLPQPAVSGSAGDQLGLAAVQGQGGRGRPVRHDHPSDRFRDGPAGADPPHLRQRRPFCPAGSDRRRPDLPAVGGRRLVLSDREFAWGRWGSGKGRPWPRAMAWAALATSGPRSTDRSSRPCIACTSPIRSGWDGRGRTWPRWTCRPST